MSNHLNLIIMFGIHTVLHAIATDNLAKALMISGTACASFMLFTGATYFVKKMEIGDSNDSKLQKPKRKRNRHQGLKNIAVVEIVD